MSTIENRLDNHPEIKKRVERMLDLADGKDSNCTTADEIEEALIIETRNLGKDVIQKWATQQADFAVSEYQNNNPGSHRDKKK